jgi:peptidoglycan/LPS O-acetylase OafA/YrhL
MFDIIDIKIFFYLSLFVGGVAFSRWKISERVEGRILLTLGIFILSILVCIHVLSGFSTSWDPLTIILLNCMIMGFITVFFSFARNVSRKIKEDWANTPFFKISYASYAVFLFHRPIFSIFSHLLKPLIELNSVYYYIFLLIMSIPTIFIASYYLQKCVNRLITNLYKGI